MVVEATPSFSEVRLKTQGNLHSANHISPVEEPHIKKYSWEEIGKHRASSDLWLVVKGKVYDVTSWVPNHPGGKLILNGGGREATALFLSYHPLHVEPLLNKYYIGEVDNYQPYYRWDLDFYPVLKKRVEACVKENNLNTSSKLMYFKTFLIIMCWMISFYFGFIKGYFLAAIALGFFHSHFGINVAHDGNHGAYSKSKIINEIASRAMDLMGASSVVWIHQHNVGHHPNSNRQGDSCTTECDQDDPDTRSGSPIVRMASAQPLLWYHQYQHFYIWLLFCFVTTKWYVNDIRSFSRGKYINIDFFKLPLSEYLFLGFAKFVYAMYVFVVPLYLHSIFRALILISLFKATMSYMFVLMFSVNHLTNESTFPDEKVTNRDWATLQVLTSSNFSVGSEFWTWMSGGLNYQIEHHLFPYLCHVYLPQISPIVQQTCKEYNVPYKAFPSFWDAFVSFSQYLKDLGTPIISKKSD